MTNISPNVPDWRRAHGTAVLDAEARRFCSDFQVTELLGFEADGDGEHDFLWIEKELQNTAWVADALAKFAGIPSNDVGFAGLKDRHAITRQWFSVRRPAGPKPDWSEFNCDGVRILEAARHGRKLRRGAHRANRFRLALRPSRPLQGGPGDEVIARLATIREQGVPNYFGEQRFGHGGRNLQLAETLFSGRRLPRNRRTFALSAARSYLFNRILEQRVADATWNRLLPGDSANLDGTGSVFPVAVVDAELERRARDLDLHPTGALWGRGDLPVEQGVAQMERAVAAERPDLTQGLETQKLVQARRALRVRVADLRWELEDPVADGDGAILWLDFSLMRGAFATAVLRELLR